MTAYEFLLSESQERMLFVVRAGREEPLMERFRRWGFRRLWSAVCWKNRWCVFCSTVLLLPRCRLSGAGGRHADQAARLIDEPPASIQQHWTWQEDDLPAAADHDWGNDLLKLLDDPTIASKRWVYRQYDQQVLANTVVSSGEGDAAVVRLRPQQGDGSLMTTVRGVAATVDCPTAGSRSIPNVDRWQRWPKPPATSAVSVPNPWRSPTT